MSFAEYSHPLPNGHFADYQLILNYQNYLAEQSPNVALIDAGYSREYRKMQLLAVSSPARIKQLKKSPDSLPNFVKQPLVIWLSFAVHGNEISGTQAALKILHQLTSTQDPDTAAWLESTVILFELVGNPDGYQRFIQKVGQYLSAYPVADHQHQQHLTPWPAARGNHYWFDLNRDWLAASQPETQNRMQLYHLWQPHLLADFHEMPSGNRYFFQPGVKTRINPLSPTQNYQLTKLFASALARQFDSEQTRYFSEEEFDDFFIGKASTYPDLQGGIGLLLEQSSSKGQLLATEDGLLSFQQSIDNQKVGIRSVINTAIASHQKLLSYRDNYQQKIQTQQQADPLSGYLVTSGGNRSRLQDFQQLLNMHNIDSLILSRDMQIKNTLYPANSSLFIPLEQKQYLLIKSLFSQQNKFKDTLFYDVSNWNLALAYHLQPVAVSKSQTQPQTRPGKVQLKQATEYPGITAPPYACLVDWHEDTSAPLLYQLLKQKVKVRVAKEAFRGINMQGPANYPAGSLLVLLSENSATTMLHAMQTMQEHNAPCQRLLSGHTEQGPDLGSRQFTQLHPVQAAILTGEGTQASEVGEIWYHFEHQLKMPLALLDKSDAEQLSLKNYSHLIMTDGNFQDLPSQFVSHLEFWLRQGGTLITTKRASVFASQHNLIRNEFLSERDLNSSFALDNLTFADKEKLQSKKMLTGSVFNVELDLSHPLAFGFKQAKIPLFRNDRIVLLTAAKPFYDVAKYTDSPLLAGYSSYENIRMIKNSTALTTHKHGQGQVIAFADNPVFRGYWRGTARLLNNALFFAPLVAH
ncbi:M14 family zinc carboxypeptidase [Gayadomonas joobiniege]|uniref:M14 family zinc carboxypeptidase n=1 Tax=Gayadomonas joobiniege TaxID=1234606 RepID=UPI0012DCB472|nr:M14 family zinc carboxypeptidase [Gayadomonas joobiniege]